MPTAVAAVGVGASLLGSHQQSKASKRAAKAQGKGQAAALKATQEAADLARSQAIPLFNSAQQNQQQGFQGALDIFGQTLPAQLNAFGGGNLNAQNTLLAGLDPQIQAILGGNIDLSGLQAQQVQQPDPAMFQQQLPQFESINQTLGINPSILGGFPPPSQFVAGPQAVGGDPEINAMFDSRFANDPAVNNLWSQRPAGLLAGQSDPNSPFQRLV